MKKIRVIYNPFSGDKKFKDSLDSIAEIFYDAGFLTEAVRVPCEESMNSAISALSDADHAVAVAGGDGSVNMAINAMKRYKKSTPLAIFPAGTANDFATFIDIPKDPRIAAQAIVDGRVISADLGVANGRHFINVCGGGLFINVSHSTDNLAKSIFGKLAYYIKGLGQIPNITPLELRITTESRVYEENFALFLLLNTGGCGGFHKIAPEASITDGYLDLIAFRATAMKDIAGLFLKILSGEHLTDRRILFSREPWVKIENLSQNEIPTDVDGEPGPDMPMNIYCEKGGVNLIVPRESLRFRM